MFIQYGTNKTYRHSWWPSWARLAWGTYQVLHIALKYTWLAWKYVKIMSSKGIQKLLVLRFNAKLRDPLLSAHTFTNKWQLPFLKPWKGKNDSRKKRFRDQFPRKYVARPGFKPNNPNSSIKCATSCAMHPWSTLTLKRQTKIAADDIWIFYCYLSKENKAWFFMWILGLAEDSLETSSLIFSEKKKRKNIYECRLLQSWLAL